MNSATLTSPCHGLTIEPGAWHTVAAPGATVLQAAEAAGIELPNSCRNGTCRTCLCRLASGSVRYLVDWPGLSLEEKRDGFILPCVAVAQTDLVVTAPLARCTQPQDASPAGPLVAGAHD